MRRAARARWPLLAAAAALLGLATAAGADEWTLRTGARLDAWTADDASGQGDGREILAPLGVWYDAPRWGLAVRGTYGASRHELDGAPDASITGFLDTTVSGYARLAVAGLDVRVGLDLDLPTGPSRLRLDQLPAVQDEDLVAVQRFGEGFDVNPTVTAYRSFGLWGVGGGLGYLRAGTYDPTRDVAGDDFDPGDQLSVAVLGDVYAGDTVRLLGRFAYTRYTVDQRGGVDTFREGDELDVTAAAEWRPEPWFATATLRDIVRLPADRLDAAGRLVAESRNSYGNELRGSVTVGYIVNDMWTLRGVVDVRHVAANDYATGNPLHDGGRLKVAVGPWVTWSLGRRLAVDASVRYFHLDAEPSPTFPRGSTFNGVHADLRLTYRF